MTFNLTAFEAAYWDEVGYLAHLRKQKAVSPFSRQVAHAVFTAGLLALEDRSRGNRVHRTLASVPIPTKPPVYNGMIAPRDSWMMPPLYNEMIPPGAPRALA